MTTNATLITSQIEEFIIENKITLTISIDGTESVHNTNRFYASGKGCYEQVIKNKKN